MTEEHSNKKRRVDHRTGVYYADYLNLPSLLNGVKTESEKTGKIAHDEHLFIVVHQAYELWFKQILFEMDSIVKIFSQDQVEESQMLIVINRMKRIVEIWKVLVDQVNILETMDSLDFMDFRDLLVPASGFQSVQFRILENKWGVKMENRSLYQRTVYKGYFSETDGKLLTETEQKHSFLSLIEKWLERIPVLNSKGYSFWNEYKSGVERMLSENEEKIKTNPDFDEKEKELLLESSKKSRDVFDTILDESQHKGFVDQGIRRLSHKAFQGALMIHLYRDEPLFNLPFQLLTLLRDVDVLISKWRYQHVQMVQRMIGSKVGTGGSSGYQYLQTTLSDKYKVFIDLFNLPTYTIPRPYIPKLPKEIGELLRHKLENGN